MNQNEEYQNMPEQYGNAPSLYKPDSKSDLLEKIQPTLIVDIIEHKLLGEEFINGKWVQMTYLINRALTKQGAHEIATLMLPVSSQNVSLSKLKDTEIRMRALSIAKCAQEMCLRNWKEYGIKGSDQLRFVHELVFSNTFITLKQPEGEGIRKFVGNMGSVDFSPQQEEPVGWGNIFRR